MEDDDVDLLGLGGVVPADPNADVSNLVAVNIVEMGSSIDPAEKTLIMSHANRAKGPLPTASSSSGKKIRSSKGGSKRNKSPMSRFLGSSTEEEPSTISRSSKPTRRGRTSGVSDDKKKYEGRNMKAKAPPPPLSESSSPPQANKEKVQRPKQKPKRADRLAAAAAAPWYVCFKVLFVFVPLCVLVLK